MTEPLLVGIDVGTSSTKAVVLSRDGVVRGLAAEAYEIDTPQPGWAEQDPESWVAAAERSVARAVEQAGASPDAVAGLSFSGQMHGAVCVDAAGRPLRPAIIWADQRSHRQVADIVARLGKQQLADWTGNPLATGFMLASWLWLQAHEPEIAQKTRWLLLPKDYVRYRLTGEIGTEPSDASSTGLFDPAARGWSQPLLDHLELDGRRLPPVHASAAVAGSLLPEAAEAMGLRPGIPVVAGGSDQAVQALGNGVVAPGVLSSTIGTGGQLLVPTERAVVDAGLRMHCFCHVVDALWHAETAMLSAGLSLRWLRDQLLDGLDYQTLAELAAGVPAGADGLFFLPYLSGERTPHMDPRARGSFVGLTRRHGRAHLVRAVMEGVVFGLRQGLDLILSLGVEVDAVVASGGATRHPLWLQLQADIYNRPVRRTRVVEAAAVGAAMLAGIGVGVFADVDAAIAQVVRRQPAAIEPDGARMRHYAAQYEAYCGLYPALRATMHRLGDAF